jgi:hypothetical protein
MRNLLRRIGARTGISLGLILVIAAIVVVFRIADNRRTDPPFQPPPLVTPSVAASEGDDGPAGETSDPGYADDAVVLAAATDFTTAWLRRTLPAAQWLDGLRPLATADLIERLTGVDPLDVPTEAVAGEPTIRNRSAIYADVLVPIGTSDHLALGLVNVDGGWLVATLDRETS